MRGWRGTVAERFERKYTPEPNSGCWIWFGSVDRRGYGQMRIGKRARIATHIALELAGRPLALGQWALHRCDNPACVNPDHLFAGTQKDNMRDCIAKGRHSKPPRFVGSANKASKLTEDQVRLIRADFKAGMSLSQFQRKYGLTQTTGSYLRLGRTWKHVS
jgi:hypothetical protein